MTVAAPPPDQQRFEEVKRRLETDDAFYCESLLKIVNQREETVDLLLKPAQCRLIQVKVQQEAEGKPVRIIVLKARREGISTVAQALMIKRVTQRENHKALVVAHDSKTAAELFGMGETMYGSLPDEVIAELILKPPIASTQKGKELRLGEQNRRRRMEGHRGLNSSYLVDTANEYEAGRGFTYHSLHLSEFAFWMDQGKKLRALLSTLPEGPESMCIIESTANAYNLFRTLWVAAVKGDSDYYPLFIPWYEDPDYSRPFANDEEQEGFEAKIGDGDLGEAELDLLDLRGPGGEQLISLEQLNWRRWAIVNRAHGDLRAFMQEFPANWEEAFLSSGRQVFAPGLVSRVLERTQKIQTDGQAALVGDHEPRTGLIQPKLWTPRDYRGNTIQIPSGPQWVDETALGDDVGVAIPRWEVWEPPFGGIEANEEIGLPHQAPGQYVVTVDSAAGLETETKGQDYFAIQVINHRTRAQCAQFHARNVDADRVMLQAFLVASWYSPEFPAILAVEITGGYGVSIASGLRNIYRYSGLYFRNPAERKGEREEDRIGWSMNGTTKPLVVDHAKVLLREGTDGIRSPALAGEMLTFVRDEKGKMGAEADNFDDLLDAWMVAQYIAHERTTRRSRWRLPQAVTKALRRAPSMRRRPRSQRYGGR